MAAGRRAQEAAATVHSLHPVRVALAGRDARFLSLAGFLLARDGYEVASTHRPDDVVALVDRHRANVVVLDGSEWLTTTAELLAAIEALYPHVAVLVVADGNPRPAFPALPKWQALRRLSAEVERAHLRRSRRERHGD